MTLSFQLSRKGQNRRDRFFLFPREFQRRDIVLAHPYRSSAIPDVSIFSLEENETIKWQPWKSQSLSMTVTIVRDEPTNLSQDSLPTYHMNDHIVERFDDGDTDGDVGRSRFQRVRPVFLSVSYGFFIFIAVLVLTLILLICL